MTDAWSLYVTVLTLGTLFAIAWLLYATRRGPPLGGENHTTGECFDGIEEYDNPLPRWWLWLFVATLVFALVYLALYPGLGNWRGVLPGYRWLEPATRAPFADGQAGWSSAHQWEKEQAQARKAFGPLYARFAAMPIETLATDPQAMAMGARLFASNCALCHGADGQGARGYPNLADNLWRWGGAPASIEASIGQGRRAVMPAWGPLLGEQGSRDTAAYVLQLSGRPLPVQVSADPANGEKLYAQACVACHGPQGSGNPLLGAPDLAQPSGFIYGARFEQVRQSIHDGRQGDMPAQAPLLGDDRVHLLAAYVYSLAGQPVAPPAGQSAEPANQAVP